MRFEPRWAGYARVMWASSARYCPQGPLYDGVLNTSREGLPVPNAPATQVRGFRLPDDIWEAVLRIAADQHVTATEIVLRALRAYIRRYPAE